MPVYVRLLNGRIMVVESDNDQEKIMKLYPVSRQHDWDRTVDTSEVHPYSDIESKSNLLLQLLTPGYEDVIRFEKFDPG